MLLPQNTHLSSKSRKNFRSDNAISTNRSKCQRAPVSSLERSEFPVPTTQFASTAYRQTPNKKCRYCVQRPRLGSSFQDSVRARNRTTQDGSLAPPKQ